MNCSSGTRFKTSIIGRMWFKSKNTKQCYTFFIIWVRCRKKTMTLVQKHYWQKFQSRNMQSPTMKLSDIKKSVSMDEDHKLDHIKYGFTHFVVDNVDHNTDTLNRKGTFHWMHIIYCSVLNKYLPDKRVKRIITILIRETIKRRVSIKLHWYQGRCSFFFKIILIPLHNTQKNRSF